MYHESDPLHGSVVPGSLPNPQTAFIGYKPLSITQRQQQDDTIATASSNSLLAKKLTASTLNITSSIQQSNNEKYHAFELLNNDIKLPAMETIFWCKVFEFRESNHKQHLVKVRH